MKTTWPRTWGLSRTPAREALALLTRDGILVHEGRSFTVPVYGAEQIAEVFEVRRRMEPYAVRVACERATAEELKSLRIAAEAALKTGASAQKYVEANFSLRQTLFSLTRNRRLQEVIHLYEDLVHFVRLKTLDQEANRELSVKGWRKLVSAVLARKADVAEEAMERLLTIAEQAMIQALQQARAREPGRDQTQTVKPPPFEYVRAHTLTEAAAMLAAGGDGTQILAGGQSLLPTLSLRLSHPARLIDINRVVDATPLAESGAQGQVWRHHAACRRRAVLVDPRAGAAVGDGHAQRGASGDPKSGNAVWERCPGGSRCRGPGLRGGPECGHRAARPGDGPYRAGGGILPRPLRNRAPTR